MNYLLIIKRYVQQLKSIKQGISAPFSAFGVVTGISVLLNLLSYYGVEDLRPGMIGLLILMAAIVSVVLLVGLQKMMRRFICRLLLFDLLQKRYQKHDLLTYAVFPLATSLGALGIYIPLSVMVFLFLLLQALLIYFLMSCEEKRSLYSSLEWLSFLFLISGFAALIYQIAWQRVLFSMFGINIESITIKGR